MGMTNPPGRRSVFASAVGVDASMIDQMKREPSWDSWRYLDRQPAGPAHFHELQRKDYMEWRPRQRSQPSICVLSTYTRNLLKPGSYGSSVATMNANWALSNGYKYSIITKLFHNKSTNAFGYGLVRNSLFMLEQGEDECAFVFFLDGDALVNNPGQTLAPILRKHMHGDIILTCNSPYGLSKKGISCGPARAPCRCFHPDANCSAVAQARARYDCRINIGGHLIRNTPTSREIMRWWSAAGNNTCEWVGRPGCKSNDRAPCERHPGHPSEQDCALKVQDRWKHHVHVVGAHVMNLPAWFHPKISIFDYKNLLANLGHEERKSTNGRLPLAVPDETLTRCFQHPELFICHPYGLRNMSFRDHLFHGLLQARLPRLLDGLRKRDEMFVNISDID
jgi:hypothetical protein